MEIINIFSIDNNAIDQIYRNRSNDKKSIKKTTNVSKHVQCFIYLSFIKCSLFLYSKKEYKDWLTSTKWVIDLKILKKSLMFDIQEPFSSFSESNLQIRIIHFNFIYSIHDFINLNNILMSICNSGIELGSRSNYKRIICSIFIIESFICIFSEYWSIYQCVLRHIIEEVPSYETVYFFLRSTFTFNTCICIIVTLVNRKVEVIKLLWKPIV